MEVPGIATLGIYLILAFVLPGFCYALVFGLCFPDVIANALKAPNEPEKASQTEGSSSTKQAAAVRALSSLTVPAIIGGLLLSSVCFFVETVSRWIAPCYMDGLFPRFGIEKISQIEAAGKGVLHLQVLSGEAIMHFNIGLGILLISLAYLVIDWKRVVIGWRRAVLVICLLITASANIVDSSVLYDRASKAATEALEQLKKSSVAIPSDASGAEPLRIVVAGDGRAEYPWAPEEKKRSEDSDGINKRITREMAQAVLDEKAQMMLWTGDLVNVNDRDPATFRKELLAWREIMQPLYDHGVIVLPVRGNHEVTCYIRNGRPEGEPIQEGTKIWNDVFSGQYALPQNGPERERNLSFFYVCDPVLVIGLDQYENGGHVVNQAWIDEVLRDQKRPFIFAYGHEPAFMAGNHTDNLAAYPLERNLLWESLLQSGARAYFCGHDHFYDHMKVVHNSGSPGPEMHQLTAGTAGAPFYDDKGYVENPGWLLKRVTHIKTHGYILITIDGNRATIAFKGQVSTNHYKVMDSFSYVAGVP